MDKNIAFARSALIASLASAAPMASTAWATPSVSFEGTPVKVEAMTVSAFPFNRYWPGHQRPKDQTKTAYFASFDTNRGGTLKVDGESRAITGSGKYTFEVENGKTELHVFADPPWQHVPVADEIYFGPGEHFPELILPKDGQTIVIDRGAVVHGTIFLYKTRGVKIVGRGILDLSGLQRADPESAVYRHVVSLGLTKTDLSEKESDPAMSCTAIVAYGVRDLLIDGIVIRDAPRWTIQVRNDSRGVTIDNVKIIGSWRYNNDGIDMCSSSEINVRNCFLRTYDDAFIVRAPFLTGEHADCRDILVEDCVTWNDWGVSMGVCQQYRPSTIAGVTFRRNRVERPSSTVATVHVTMGSTNAVIRDVLYEDISVNSPKGLLKQQLQLADDDAFVAQPLPALNLLTVSSRKLGQWQGNQKIVDSKGPGWYQIHFDNLVFRNIAVTGEGPRPFANFSTYVPNHRVTNLVCENLPPDLTVTRKGKVELTETPQPNRHAYVVPNRGPVSFRLDLGKPCFPTPVRTVLAREMRSFAASTNDDGVVTLAWKGHRLCGADFSVTGTYDPKTDSFSLRTADNASGYDIQRTSFPEPIR